MNTELKKKILELFFKEKDKNEVEKFYSTFLGDDFQYEALKEYLNNSTDEEIMNNLFDTYNEYDNVPKEIYEQVIKPESKRRILII